MKIHQNSSKRFDICYSSGDSFRKIDSKGFEKKDNEKVTGVAGYHGHFQNIIGWILAHLGHKTVSVKGTNGTYYLNCNSLEKWLKRVDPETYHESKKIEVTNHKFVQRALENIVKRREVQAALIPNEENKDEKVSDAKKDNTPKGLFDIGGLLNDVNFKLPEARTEEEKLEIALHEAIICGSNQDCLDLIENKGAKANFQSIYKTSHLGTAIILNKLEICTLLVENGADPNKKGSSTKLPLELAIASLNPNIIELLIDKGAKVDEKTSDGRTMKEYANALLSKEEVTRLFK